MELIVTFCDYCNPGQSERPINPEAFAECDEETCIEYFGWVRAEKGIMCPKCQEDLEMKIR